MTSVNPSEDASPDASGDEEAAAPRKRAARRKADAVLIAAVEQARAGLLEVVEAAQIGEYVGAEADADRLVTHRFQALRPGYNGWQWYSTLARAPRSKKVTVCEVGLLPSAESLLAPEWVPWSQRVRPEDVAQEQAEQEQADREQAEQDQAEQDQAAAEAAAGAAPDTADASALENPERDTTSDA